MTISTLIADGPRSTPRSEAPRANTARKTERTPTANSNAAILSLRNVSVTFLSAAGEYQAMRDLSLDINEREFLSIVGPSGCGKSTLLNVIVGLIKPSKGEILFRGVPIKGIQPQIGYITQADNLLPWRTLIDNVGFALEMRGIDKPTRRARAVQLLTQVGLAKFENHYPHELSGGMRQRGNIARTLAYDPDVILMDEPFGPLDAQTRLTLQRQLLELWQGAGKTVLFVTHDLQEAVTLSDRVAIISARPGKITVLENIDIARPRQIPEIHDDEHFRALHRTLWTKLEKQVDQVEASLS